MESGGIEVETGHDVLVGIEVETGHEVLDGIIVVDVVVNEDVTPMALLVVVVKTGADV